MTTITAFNPRWSAVLAGLSRGWIETRQNFTETPGVTVHVFPAVFYLVLLLVFSRITPPDAHVSFGALMVPSFLAMGIITSGLSTPAGGITTDREEGTLLRAKATPNGMLGYLVGKLVTCSLTALLGFILILVPGILLASGFALSARTGLLLMLTFAVGMVSTVPVGVALGSILKSSSQIPLVALGSTFISMISVFLPITLLPTWAQSLVQAFPAYWVGLGVRAAMLPPEMVQPELDQWSAIGLFAVPAVWAALGLLLAPILLRRMARRQSGSAVAKMRARIRSKGS